VELPARRVPSLWRLMGSGGQIRQISLSKIIGHADLTFEEIQTILVETEVILNLRPITPLSANPNNLSYLTLRHFLASL